ncbi:MAG: hypothetical protein GXN93_05260 [Candidatus Diapherotrites archaeon]|nr:hypothetical protein [Candidatus Diapherotrites archaeon]
MDSRGQASTEYLLLTSIGILVAVIGYMSVVVLMKKAQEAIQTVNTYRTRLVQTLAG